MDSLFERLYSVVQFQIYKMSFYDSLIENLHLEQTSESRSLMVKLNITSFYGELCLLMRGQLISTTLLTLFIKTAMDHRTTVHSLMIRRQTTKKLVMVM